METVHLLRAKEVRSIAPGLKPELEIMDAEISPADLRLLSDCLKHWQRRLYATPEAQAACKMKGWVAADLERLRIGYADGFLADATPADQRNQLRRLGLLDDEGCEVLRGRLIVPHLTDSGKLESLEALPIDGSGRKLIRFHSTGATELAEDGSVTVIFGGVQYTAKNLKGGADYRCLLRAEVGQAVHVDKLDLASSKNRSAFAKDFESAGGPFADTVRADLLRVMKEIDRAGELSARQQQSQPEMTAAEREEALALLKGAVLAVVKADLLRLGYVGEEDTKVLAFLVAISRKLPSCLSLILQSSSAAGKSFLMECVSKLCPAEDVLYFSRISAQSLYYMKPGALKHRLVLVDERNGSDEADYSIRTLQTRRQLSLAVPIKDAASGKTETQTFTVEGPIAYMESTTQPVHPENASRAFVVSLEESPEQTNAIMQAQRKQALSLPADDDETVKSIIRRHQNAQRLLRALPVVIPFADRLKFACNADPVKTRREHQRFLTLIQAAALLYQHQRKIKTANGTEYVEASREDEQIARQIMEALMRKGHAELSDHAAAMLRWLQKQPAHSEFSRRQLQESLSWSYRKTRDAIDELERHDFIVRLGRVAGQTYRYKLVSMEPTPIVTEEP